MKSRQRQWITPTWSLCRASLFLPLQQLAMHCICQEAHGLPDKRHRAAFFLLHTFWVLGSLGGCTSLLKACRVCGLSLGASPVCRCADHLLPLCSQLLQLCERSDCLQRGLLGCIQRGSQQVPEGEWGRCWLLQALQLWGLPPEVDSDGAGGAVYLVPPPLRDDQGIPALQGAAIGGSASVMKNLTWEVYCLVCLGGMVITLRSACQAGCSAGFGWGCLPHSQEAPYPGRTKRDMQASIHWH